MAKDKKIEEHKTHEDEVRVLRYVRRRYTQSMLLAESIILLALFFNNVLFRTNIPTTLGINNPITVICFLCITTELTFLHPQQENVHLKKIGLVFSITAVIISSLILAHYITGKHFVADTLFQTKPISPNSAICFLIAGTGLAIVTIKENKARILYGVSMIIVFFVGFTAILGYIFHVESLYHVSRTTPMPIFTAILFAVYAIAANMSYPDHGILRVLTSGKATSVIVKRLLVFAFLLPPLFEYAKEIGLAHGLYGKHTGDILLVILNVAVCFILVKWIAVKLYHFENSKDLSEQSLKKQTKELAKRIIEIDETKKELMNILEDLEIAKDNLEHEKAKDEAIIDNIGEGMIVTDNEGKILLANKAALTLMHTKLSQIIGKYWGVDIPNIEDENGTPVSLMHTVLHQALKKRKRTVKSILYKINGHSKIPVVAVGTPIILDDGELLGGIVIFRDVSHEREVDRMKTEFITIASHQLRTPLSSIRWFSEMLLTGDAGKLSLEQKKFIKNISQSADHMLELVNSLLNISRIESGLLVTDPRLTNLAMLVEEILVEVRGKIIEKDLHITKNISKKLSRIMVDQKLIRQVYLNLLTNAIKYTPAHGNISIIISEQKDEIISQISDDGYGIPKNQQKKIFQKFYRGENIVTIETDGSGLGLYLVKSIIDSSQGKIWFTSEEGRGTSFWFSLPRARSLPKQIKTSIDRKY